MPTDVARALGDLEGTVRSLQAQWERQESAAVAGRRIVHEKVDALSAQVAIMHGGMKSVQQDVAKIKKDMDETVMPALDEYALGKATRQGAVDMGKLIWAGVIGICTLTGFAIHEILQYLAKGGTLPKLPLH